MNKTNLTPIKWDDATLQRAIDGKFTVWQYDRQIPYTLTKQERAQFEQAKEQGYAVYGQRSNLHSVFYAWCGIHHWPHIHVDREGRHAHVVMDIPFRDKELSSWSQELVRVAYDYASGPRSGGNVGPIYTHADRIDQDRAEFLAQSFVAIYRRNAGEDVALPVYPAALPENTRVRRLEEAIERHYMATYTVRDTLGTRWEFYCEARHLPYIRLHEARKGKASLRVDLPDGLTFTPDMLAHIRRAGQEIHILSFREVRKASSYWYDISESRLNIRRPIPTDDTTYFAQAIVRILDRAGYFQERQVSV